MWTFDKTLLDGRMTNHQQEISKQGASVCKIILYSCVIPWWEEMFASIQKKWILNHIEFLTVVLVNSNNVRVNVQPGSFLHFSLHFWWTEIWSDDETPVIIFLKCMLQISLETLKSPSTLKSRKMGGLLTHMIITEFFLTQALL